MHPPNYLRSIYRIFFLFLYYTKQVFKMPMSKFSKRTSSKYTSKPKSSNYIMVKKPVSWYNKKYSASPLEIATQALKGVNYIKGLVNSERHITDISSAYSGTLTNATTNQTMSLNRVAQGDTNSTRTGNSILLKSVQIKGFITWNASSFNDRVRFLLVQDTQQINDTIPNWSDFYTGDINSFPRDFAQQRFKVLGSYVYKQDIDNSKSEIAVNIYKTFQTHVKYNGPLETDIAYNGLYLVMISNKSVNPPTLALNTRTTFHDN